MTTESALSQPGPHGYPMRFAVRTAGSSVLKIHAGDRKQPIRYIEWHSMNSELRQVLHKSGHKEDNSPALVSVRKPRGTFLQRHAQYNSGSGTVRPLQPQNFILDIHRPNGYPETVQMHYSLNHPSLLVSFRSYTFSLRTPFCGAGPGQEQFEWREINHSLRELRGIRKMNKPRIQTGDPRPSQGTFRFISRGYILVRLTGKRVAAGKQRPLGFTEQGEEIVASWAMRNTTWVWSDKFLFQFWGAAAKGELGEEFTHVAVASGSALWQEMAAREQQKAQQQARQRRR